jgi:HEAT repeat protein
MSWRVWLVVGGWILGGLWAIGAEDRDPEMARRAATGQLKAEASKPTMAGERVLDYTKGEPLPTDDPEEIDKLGLFSLNWGPTGIVGRRNGRFDADQIEVLAVLPGSPAHGKVLPGDVILGVAGKKFALGGHIGVEFGNAIIKAEEKANKGVLQLSIWRDKNWPKRNEADRAAGIDLEELFAELAADGGLYDWKTEDEKTQAVHQQGFDKFPIDAEELDVTLLLTTMGTYSDTSPYDCEVAGKIRENAWKVIEKRFEPQGKGRGRVQANTLDVVALLASGKPEHRELTRTWVRSEHAKVWRPEGRMTVGRVQSPRGKTSWAMGFYGLECAIYYDTTGDDYVLPALREFAVATAKGQNGGGTWGHGFALPKFNGGEFNRNNPGYGAVNNPGTRCFFLLALAHKNGVKDQEIVDALVRSERFYDTYVEKGTIPYGFHPSWGGDDSNGKNFGAAYALKLLGNKRGARYYAQLATHAAFSRRGGHGSPNLWHYTPMCNHMAGPEGTIAAMRNMRWFYTLARRHDGAFVVQGEQVGIGGKPVRSATATYALHYSAPLKQTIITGKYADESLWHTDKDMKQLLVSAIPQITDPHLLEKAGKPMVERSTDQLFELTDHFFPVFRRKVGAELGKRYGAGEKNIVARAIGLLTAKSPRSRESGIGIIAASGQDAVLQNLSKITPLLDDPEEIVRIAAVKTIGWASNLDDKKRYEALLTAAAAEYDTMTLDQTNVRAVVKEPLLGGKLFPGQGAKKAATAMATAPFEQGLDPKLVRDGLTRIITMDPGGHVSKTWTRDTAVRLAGGLVFVGDEMQINDSMFGFARTGAARELLKKHGYREAVECDTSNLRTRYGVDRAIIHDVTFKINNLNPPYVMEDPASYQPVLPLMRDWLYDNPVASLEWKINGTKRVSMKLDELVEMVSESPKRKPAPSIGQDVDKQFAKELAEVGSGGKQIAYCRKVLKDPNQFTNFRQMSAMSRLVEMTGADAAFDVAPFLGHDRWRVAERARDLTLQLLKMDPTVADQLIGKLAKAEGDNAAGILDALRLGKVKAALEPARAAMKHKDWQVRRAAVRAVLDLEGSKGLQDILAFMESATDYADLESCELALVTVASDRAATETVRKAMMGMVGKPGKLSSCLWILANIGGNEGLSVIEKYGKELQDKRALRDLAISLSYSPAPGAEALMLKLAKMDELRAELMAAEAPRQMIGVNGSRDVPVKKQLDFAEAMLRLNYHKRLISYLAQVPSARSANLLFGVLKKTGDEGAGKGIVELSERMAKRKDVSANESKRTGDVLSQVIEYIEVTHLRGGPAGKHPKIYPIWKDYQARAGKALLKLHKPKAAAIPAFDDSDLDF